MVTALLEKESEGGLSLDSISADKELKAVIPEKSKVSVTAFTKKVVTSYSKLEVIIFSLK